MAKAKTPEPTKTNPLAVRFRPELRTFLSDEAGRLGMSVNALVNDIVAKRMHWRAGMARREAP